MPAANTSASTMLNLSRKPMGAPLTMLPYAEYYPFGFKAPVNLVTWLQRASRADPARVAIYSGERPWATYGELARRAASVAGALRGRLGLTPGDRVAVCMANAPEYLVALYGAWWAGLVAVPVNAKLHAREVEYIAGHSGARFVVSSPADVAQLESGEPIGLEAVDSGALAWLFYTSGTTGRPKG